MRRSLVVALVLALVSASFSGRAAAAAFTVNGTVLKPDGTAAAGVLVRADNSFGGAVIAMTTTDASGNYSFSLDAGTYTFVYIPADNTLATQVYDGQRSTAPASTQTPISANTTLNTQTLVAAHLVTGRVTRESDGAPIANADVWFLLGGTLLCCYFVRGAVTDGSGNYQVGLATGTWKAWSRAAGYDGEWYLGMAADYGHAGWLTATDITVVSSTVSGVDFSLGAASTASADLSLTLVDSADPVLSTYTSYSYTAVVSNLGPAAPSNVVVTFTLSPNLTYLFGTGCVATLPTVTCAVGTVTMPVAALPTIHVQPNGGGTSATVSAVVSSELADPVSTNNTDTETTTITPVADLELVSLTGPATANAGDVVTFTATARNNSTHYAIPQSGIEISLPAGLTFQSITGSATATACGPQSPPWPPVCLFGPLAPGAQESATLTAIATSPGAYVIQAQTGNLGSIIELDPANNTKSSPMTVSATPTADVSVIVTESTDPALIGSVYSYTLTVTSAGPTTVDVEISLALPSNLELVGVPAGCTLTSPVVCSFAALQSGGTVSLNFFVRALSGTSATVTAMVGGAFTDPDLSDNTATETTTLNPPSADLSLILSESADPVLSTYTSYQYTAAVWNIGPSTPVNATVTFTLPSNLTYLFGTGCVATLPTVTCAIGTLLPPVGSSTVTLATIHVQPNGGGTSATVSAVVSSELADPVAANNSATETTVIAPVADLELVSLTGPATANAGDVVTFTATARNNSTHYAIPQSGIEISLPAGLTFQSITGSATATACGPQSPPWPPVCLFGPLAPGAQESATLTAIATSPGAYVIQAQTGNLGSIIELDPANNTKNANLTATGDAASGNLSPGTSVTTDGEGDGTTLADPVETTVSSPGGPTGPVTITETPATGTPPSGWSFFGQQIVITAPAATAMNPLVIVFDINDSVIPAGQTASTIQIFRNGVPVGDCTATGPIVPDPCIGARMTTATGVRIYVTTSAASTWNFGSHLPFSFQGFRAPLDGQRSTVQAGSTVPVKFSLGGDQGMHVLASAYTTACGSTARTSIVASALRYDAAAHQYILNWRTDRGWSGCRELVLELTDGSSHRVMLQFR